MATRRLIFTIQNQEKDRNDLLGWISSSGRAFGPKVRWDEKLFSRVHAQVLHSQRTKTKGDSTSSNWTCKISNFLRGETLKSTDVMNARAISKTETLEHTDGCKTNFLSSLWIVELSGSSNIRTCSKTWWKAQDAPFSKLRARAFQLARDICSGERKKYERTTN